VARRIKAASRIVLFLDFDGTLTPIRRRPEDVPPLNLATRGLLHRLASHHRLKVIVISGRRLVDLRSRVHAPGVHLLGLYGWEGRGTPPLRTERKLLQRVKRLVRDRLSALPGIWIEDKKLAIAVHYRGALSAEVQAARRVVREVLDRFQPDLRLIEEKKAWQVVPCAVGGKGSAVRKLLGKWRKQRLAIFAGDDLADESAFAALPYGITVQVGNTRPTEALFYLHNPGEVLTFLRRLEAEIT
jgi:trehalose 6-phosphate phosphatase